MHDRKKIRVGVIFGGKSGEHEVSLTSAKHVMAAIDQERYDVIPIGITKEGLWLTGADVRQQLADQAEMPRSLTPRGDTELDPDVPPRGLVPFLDETVVARGSGLGQLDVVFPILHGPLGEDGTVQGFLELAGLPYVGAGVTASALAMDKAASKAIFQAHGLPIAPFQVVLRKGWLATPERVIEGVESAFAYPVFVKPANLGSSVGINKAHDRAGLRTALDEAALFDRKLLVEQGIEAREIEVSVLGNDDPIASVPGEIIPSREFYSYAAKYIDDTSQLLIPAPLDEDLTRAIREIAVLAYQSIDCAGMARVDFLLDKRSDEIFLNEVNTIPGFTPISMYPKLWEATGVSYSELIDRLIELAFERHSDRQQSRSSFDLAKAT
jgi:D-alanine-D-alanine ligase